MSMYITLNRPSWPRYIPNPIALLFHKIFYVSDFPIEVVTSPKVTLDANSIDVNPKNMYFYNLDNYPRNDP